MTETINFLKSICKAEGIIIESFPFKGNMKGCAIRDGDTRLIAYDEKLTVWNTVNTIAHELAHCLLHFDDDALSTPITSNDAVRQDRELEARIFSSVFTALALYEHYRQVA